MAATGTTPRALLATALPTASRETLNRSAASSHARTLLKTSSDVAARSRPLFKNVFWGVSCRRDSNLPKAIRTVKCSASLEGESQNKEAFTKKIAQSVFSICLATLQTFVPFHVGSMDSAQAILYSPDTKVPKTAEVALRKSIPPVNTSMKVVQESLDEIFYFLRIPQRKPFGTMENNVKKSFKIMIDNKESIINQVPESSRPSALVLYDKILNTNNGLEGLLASIAEKDPDKLSIRLTNVLDNIAQLELLQAPTLPYAISSQYASLPRLTGRAVAELDILKADGSSFTSLEGRNLTGKIEIVLDGYSAPLTTGNFANLLLNRAYDGVAVKVSSQAILTEGRFQNLGNSLPLEILPSGEYQPIYKTPLDVQDGELPVLPMSVYGSVAMSHAVDSETSSHPSQFFFYLYDRRNSGLGSLSFEEGQFSVFGYVTRGKEILSQIRTGDVIQSARLISGMDKLFLP